MQANALVKDLLHALGAAASECVDNAEDEGDRAYFGSTNHLDMLREAAKAYQAYQFQTGDFGDEGEFADDEENAYADLRASGGLAACGG